MILFSLLTWWLLVQKREKERDFLYKKGKKRKRHFKLPSWQGLVGHLNEKKNIQNRLCLPRKPFLRFSWNFCFWGVHKVKYQTKTSRPSWRWQRILCLSFKANQISLSFCCGSTLVLLHLLEGRTRTIFFYIFICFFFRGHTDIFQSP